MVKIIVIKGLWAIGLYLRSALYYIKLTIVHGSLNQYNNIWLSLSHIFMEQYKTYRKAYSSKMGDQETIISVESNF